jgi:ABC-type ATPase with predicted acetyltransferase domain
MDFTIGGKKAITSPEQEDELRLASSEKSLPAILNFEEYQKLGYQVRRNYDSALLTMAMGFKRNTLKHLPKSYARAVLMLRTVIRSDYRRDKWGVISTRSLPDWIESDVYEREMFMCRYLGMNKNDHERLCAEYERLKTDKHPDFQKASLFDLQITVNGIPVKTEELRAFKRRYHDVISAFPKVQRLELSTKIILNREDADALIKTIDEHGLF